MNKLPLLVLIFLSLNAWSQPGGPPKKVILFENHKGFFIFRIGEGQNLSVSLPGERKVTGPVWEIRSDTILIGDTMIVAGDILEIRKGANTAPPSETPAGPRFRPPVRQPADRSVGFYRADTSVWKIVCPPAQAYASRWSYHAYLSKRERILKREKDATYNPLIYKNFLKFNLLKLVHLEIAFAYERVIAPKLSWETEISFIFGIQGADAHYMMPYPAYNYNGFSVTTNPKYYIISPRGYLGMVFMYRYLWFDQVRTGWPDDDAAGELQDQDRNDYGLSLRIGMMRRYGQMVVDWYLGGGVKIIQLHQLVYAHYTYADSDSKHWLHEDHSPDVYDMVFLGPVINAGIKIGFGF
jgi:hypothetical protein